MAPPPWRPILSVVADGLPIPALAPYRFWGPHWVLSPRRVQGRGWFLIHNNVWGQGEFWWRVLEVGPRMLHLPRTCPFAIPRYMVQKSMKIVPILEFLGGVLHHGNFLSNQVL